MSGLKVYGISSGTLRVVVAATSKRDAAEAVGVAFHRGIDDRDGSPWTRGAW